MKSDILLPITNTDNATTHSTIKFRASVVFLILFALVGLTVVVTELMFVSTMIQGECNVRHHEGECTITKFLPNDFTAYEGHVDNHNIRRITLPMAINCATTVPDKKTFNGGYVCYYSDGNMTFDKPVMSTRLIILNTLSWFIACLMVFGAYAVGYIFQP